MRRCLLDDLLAAARCLALVPPQQRPDLARRLITEAHAAHHYHRHFARPHPRWGNGSLMTRALAGATARGDDLCLASLAVIAAAVDQFRKVNARRRLGLSDPEHLCYTAVSCTGKHGHGHGRNQGENHGG